MYSGSKIILMTHGIVGNLTSQTDANMIKDGEIKEEGRNEGKRGGKEKRKEAETAEVKGHFHEETEQVNDVEGRAEDDRNWSEVRGGREGDKEGKTNCSFN